MSVITSLTAQNTTGVSGVSDVTPEFVGSQLDAVMTDLPADAAKTGMLSNAGIIRAVSGKVREYGLEKLVVDPVMIGKSGFALIQPDATDVLRKQLAPLALVITPNLEEAGVLSGQAVRSVEDMKEAARRISDMGPRFVLVKGGHLKHEAVDVLYDGNGFLALTAGRIATQDSHGTGCVLSAAITANLAKGMPVVEAVRLAKEFVTAAIRNALRIGSGCGPCDPLALARTSQQ